MGIYQKATEFAGLPVIEYQPEVGIVLPTMPRRVFRLDNGMVEKFWAISMERNHLTIESGKASTAGQSDRRVPPDGAAAAAQIAYGKLVASKIEGGYAEVKQPGASLREALAAALRADPDDQVSRMVFADYLAEQGEQLPAVAYRVDEAGYDEKGYGTIANLQAFLAEPAVGLVQALVVGSCWAMADSSQSNAEVVQTLVAARHRLTSLHALFLGDILREECEISWIVQSDLTDFLAAFPKLEHFRTRGGIDLVLRPFEHQHLRSLVIEASNLSRKVVRAVGASELPSLEHLELWLGTDEYGADTTPDDLNGILQGKHLPSLRHLGLRNSEIADDIPGSLAGAPILERLRVLDLSLGTMTDRGAEALLTLLPGLKRLEKLDVHHHYISPAMVERLAASGAPVDASDPMEAQDIGAEELYRFVAHSE
jgi:uncharacterized protein (TIGR02996 family)